MAKVSSGGSATKSVARNALFAGAPYLVMVHENGVQYFWSQDLPATFPEGTINESWWDFGDIFPTQTDGAQWYLVDLRYNTDVISVPVNPGTTASFSGGAWSGASNRFNVLATPKLAIATFSNSVVRSWPVAASGFNLQQASAPPGWTNVLGTYAVMGDRYGITNPIGVGQSFFRLQKPWARRP